MDKGHHDLQIYVIGRDVVKVKGERLPVLDKVAPKTEGGVTATAEMEGGVTATAEMDSSSGSAAFDKLKQRREQEPLLFCKLIAKYPLASFLFTMIAQLAVVLVSVHLVDSGYDLLPVDFENVPLELNDLPWRPRDLAWHYRNSYPNFYNRKQKISYRTNSYPLTNINMYYDGEGSNVFTKDRLETIRGIENRLSSVPEYVNKYCQLDVQGKCKNPSSVLRYFDGTFSHISPVFNDPTFSNIVGVVYEAYTNNDTKSEFQFFLGKSHKITSTTAFSGITRSVIPTGFPLPRYGGGVHGFEDELRQFLSVEMEPLLKDVMENVGVFRFTYFSGLLWKNYVVNQAWQDAKFAVGSACFIFALILIHTGSLWIAGLAIFSILTSFGTSILIYRVVLDFRYLGFFHVVTLFIALGIGADDVFVFYDIWKNTGYEYYPSLAHRLSDTYRKSVLSMLFTSVTTAVAFFSCAISPLLATRSFGVFSGLVVIMNYLSVCIYFPTVVVMFHTKYENYRWPFIAAIKDIYKEVYKCCTKLGDITRSFKAKRFSLGGEFYITNAKVAASRSLTKVKDLSDNKKILMAKPQELSKTKLIINRSGDLLVKTKQINDSQLTKREPLHVKNLIGFDDISNTNGYLNQALYTVDGNKSNTVGAIDRNYLPKISRTRKFGAPKIRKQKGLLVRFFREKYFRFVTNKVCRIFILLACTTVLVFFTIQATQLELDTTGIRLLKDTHTYSVARDHGLSSFLRSDSDQTIDVYVVWGMLANDMSECHFSTPGCDGKRVWDPTFNPNTPEAQLAVMKLCDKMKNFETEEAYKLRLKSDVITGKNQIDCYMNSLRDFLDTETASTGTDWGLPYNYTKAIAFMSNRTRYYDPSGFTTAYKDYLEIPISDWLSNKQTYQYTDDFSVFDELIGEVRGKFSKSVITQPEKKYGNTIRYVGIRVKTTLSIESLGYSQGIPIMTEWENFINEEMKLMPTGMQNGFQLTDRSWNWLVMQQSLVNNAVYGTILSVSFAYPLSIIATGNIITGSLVVLTVCCSTVCVIGVIPLGGWKLGIIQSLNMCMVTGLTVDYVVHLAKGYTLSLRTDRLSRVQDMLDEMAVSIFFGACTTLGASMFMFMTELSFFFQFGIFMFSTIGFSLFFSLLLFVTLMGIIGPQGNTGDVMSLIQNIFRRCKGSRGTCKHAKPHVDANWRAFVLGGNASIIRRQRVFLPRLFVSDGNVKSWFRG